MNGTLIRPVRLSLVAIPLLLVACTRTPPRASGGPPSEITVGRSVRDDVLARYGTPDQILLQPGEEVWIYNGRNRTATYIDAVVKLQAAMTTPADPAVDARNTAMREAVRSSALASLRSSDPHELSRFVFDRRSEHLRSVEGPWPP